MSVSEQSCEYIVRLLRREYTHDLRLFVNKSQSMVSGCVTLHTYILLSKTKSVCLQNIQVLFKHCYHYIFFNYSNIFTDAITPSIAWRWESWKEEAPDDLPWKDERVQSSIRRTLELFKRRRWGNFWERRGGAHMGFSELRDAILH